MSGLQYFILNKRRTRNNNNKKKNVCFFVSNECEKTNS